MVVAQQVQDAVNEQTLKFVRHAAFALSCLAAQRIDGDDDVAQQIGADFVGQRKRQDVGRGVAVAVAAVQFMDRRIGYEAQAQFRPRVA